jgi:uncharacterized Zn finger protein (UPF0148 family)
MDKDRDIPKPPIAERYFYGEYYKCPCCKSAYFEKNGDYNICPVCNWENDKTQNADPEYRGGANSLCLNEAIVQYRKQFLNE